MELKEGRKVRATEDAIDLTKGRVYTLVEDQRAGSDFIRIIDDKEHYNHPLRRFTIIDETTIATDLVAQIELAKSFIGKRITSGGDSFIADDIQVIVTQKQADETSFYGYESFKKKGFTVTISGNSYTVPVERVELAVEEIEVVLNDTYTAKVTKDTIQVGCQTFPISILDALFDAHEKIS